MFARPGYLWKDQCYDRLVIQTSSPPLYIVLPGLKYEKDVMSPSVANGVTPSPLLQALQGTAGDCCRSPQQSPAAPCRTAAAAQPNRFSQIALENPLGDSYVVASQGSSYELHMNFICSRKPREFI